MVYTGEEARRFAHALGLHDLVNRAELSPESWCEIHDRCASLPAKTDEDSRSGYAIAILEDNDVTVAVAPEIAASIRRVLGYGAAGAQPIFDTSAVGSRFEGRCRQPRTRQGNRRACTTA